MASNELSSLFNTLLGSMPNINMWPDDFEFVFGDLTVPEDMPGFYVYSEQFKSPAITKSSQKFCFVSEMKEIQSGEYIGGDIYVVEVGYRFAPFRTEWEAKRWFNIHIVFDDKGNLINGLSTLKMYEKGELFSSDNAPPLPELPEPLGNAVDIAKWGIDFLKWILEFEPNDWGGLGIALGQIAELMGLVITTADSVLIGKTNKDLVVQNTMAIFDTISRDQGYEPGKYGICKVVEWKKDNEARIYQPRVIAGAASWTILLKVDIPRSALKTDDHLIVSITGRYSHGEHGLEIIGVMSSWKFADESPEEGDSEFPKIDNPKFDKDCFDEWVMHIGTNFSSPEIQDFVNWFASDWLRPWIIEVRDLELKQPNVD